MDLESCGELAEESRGLQLREYSLDLMPGFGALPGIAAPPLSQLLPVSRFLRSFFFSKHFSCHYRVSESRRACDLARYGFPTASLAQERRTTASALSHPVLELTFGNSRLWQSQILLTSVLASRSHKGITSVRNQAQDDTMAAPSSTANSYKTLAGPWTFTMEVKKSKFIAVAAPVHDEAAALSFLSQVFIRKPSI